MSAPDLVDVLCHLRPASSSHDTLPGLLGVQPNSLSNIVPVQEGEYTHRHSGHQKFRLRSTHMKLLQYTDATQHSTAAWPCTDGILRAQSCSTKQALLLYPPVKAHGTSQCWQVPVLLRSTNTLEEGSSGNTGSIAHLKHKHVPRQHSYNSRTPLHSLHSL